MKIAAPGLTYYANDLTDINQLLAIHVQYQIMRNQITLIIFHRPGQVLPVPADGEPADNEPGAAMLDKENIKFSR